MKTTISALALVAALGLSSAAFGQVPSGGADAKGNAPLKHAHTVNDGGARNGATSFTQKQAQKHIADAGYTDVSALTKGKDGVWRGTASKNGATLNVGMDFKGNVVEAGPAGTGAMTGSGPRSMATSASTTTSTTTTAGPATVHHTMGRHHRRRHHRRHHVAGRCADPTPNGAACSGVDRNHNGISDKEDRAIKAGAKP